LKTSDQQHPRIKDGVGFQRGGKENTKIKVNEHGFPKFVKEKVKAPIVHTSNTHVVLCRTSHVRHIVSHAKITHVPHVKSRNASNGPYMSYHTFDASYVLSRKNGKVVWSLAEKHQVLHLGAKGACY
jgi:hypothetical protein